MEKNIKISNKAQIEKLVDLVEKNPQIGRGIGQFGCSRQQINETWAEFAKELNSLGPPMRTAQDWQRVWTHCKANLKRKMAKNKENMVATGGGPSAEISLSSTEERVFELINLNTSINPPGIPMGLDFVALDSAVDDNCDSPIATALQEPTAAPSHTPTPNKRKGKAVQNTATEELLQQQTETQREVLRTLQKLEKTAYKIYDLKKKRLEIAEKQEKEKRELRKLKLKIATAKLERFSYMD